MDIDSRLDTDGEALSDQRRSVSGSAVVNGHRIRAPRKLKLLLFNEFFFPDSQGGTGSTTAEFAARLAYDHAFDIQVIASRFSYRQRRVVYPKHELWGKIAIHRAAGPNWGRAKAAKRFIGNIMFALSATARAMTLPRPDVVLVTSAPVPMPIAARFLHRFRGVPYAYLLYDVEPNRTVALKVKSENSKAVSILRKWQDGWLRDAEVVITIGRCMRDHVLASYGLDPSRVVVIEVGADESKVVPIEGPTEFQRANGLDGFIVLYAGNHGQYHDFDTLLGAAQRLKDQHPEVTFVVVGNGFKRGYLEQKVKELELTNVRLFDFVPEEQYADLLASGQLHLVSLDVGMEGLCVPSKFYSSLAAGRRVVALMPEDTEVAKAVREAGCGACIAPGDVDGLVAEIEMSVKNPKMLLASGKRARQALERQFSATRVAEKFASVLKQCCSLEADC